MEEIKIVRSAQVESKPLPGAPKGSGWVKRMIYPPNAMTQGVFLGVAEVLPGHSPHRWHTHTVDKGEGYEITYPKGFEEIYYVVQGNGVVQWKTGDGKVKEEKVSAGDAIFFPRGVSEHQVLNNSSEKMFVLFCGGPLHKVTFTNKDSK